MWVWKEWITFPERAEFKLGDSPYEPVTYILRDVVGHLDLEDARKKLAGTIYQAEVVIEESDILGAETSSQVIADSLRGGGIGYNFGREFIPRATINCTRYEVTGNYLWRGLREG